MITKEFFLTEGYIHYSSAVCAMHNAKTTLVFSLIRLVPFLFNVVMCTYLHTICYYY